MSANREWPSVDDREFEFIRLALASRLFPERPFPNPPVDLDWERLDFLLRQHRLSAHFYVLGKSGRYNWPTPFRERLRLDHYSLIIYSDQFISRIKPVLEALKKANIPVIVLKGWALIQTIYGGNHGHRIYEDIDILVHPQDVDAAEVTLKKLGWQPEEEPRPGYARCYYNAQAYFLEQIENPGRVYSIGFHWGLLHHPAYNPEQIDVKEIFRRAHPLKIADVSVLEMSIDDQIVYYCAHIVIQHHSDQSLLRYYEIAAVIRELNSNLDWQKVEKHAKGWKLVLPLKKVIQKVEELWPGTVPTSVVNSIEKNKPAMSEEFIHSWYEITNYNSSFEHLLTWLTMLGIKRRFLYIFEEVFPNQEFMAKNYGFAPAGFWPLLYIRRFLLVLGRLVK
jgi:hypothetical protein